MLSVTAAWKGHADLALSNALGGIAVQTAFLAVARYAYRRANPGTRRRVRRQPDAGRPADHADGDHLWWAPSPAVTVFGVHPATPALLAIYMYGLHLVQRVRDEPMWRPARTRETREDVPEEENLRLSLTRLLLVFVGLAALLGLAGFVLGRRRRRRPAHRPAADHRGSAAHRHRHLAAGAGHLGGGGAARRLTLAVGGIIGGNAFDTLFTAASDIAYREGSIYARMDDGLLLWVSLSILMTGFLLMGLVRREQHGPGGIGFESLAVLVLYGLGIALVLGG